MYLKRYSQHYLDKTDSLAEDLLLVLTAFATSFALNISLAGVTKAKTKPDRNNEAVKNIRNNWS